MWKWGISRDLTGLVSFPRVQKADHTRMYAIYMQKCTFHVSKFSFTSKNNKSRLKMAIQ